MKKLELKKALGFLVALAFVFTFISSMPAIAEDKAKDAKADAQDDEPVDEDGRKAGISYKEEVVVLDKATIVKVIKKRNKGILYCYEKELQTNQKIKGRVLLNFTIELDGKVSGTKIVKKKTSMKDKKVQKCVLDIMKSLRFPKRKAGEPIEINYPFNFQPKAK